MTLSETVANLRVTMIVRSARTANFTVINNAIIDDSELDWRDLGLLVFLLSKPDNWEVSVDYLCKQKKLGRDGIYASLNVLTKAGYVSQERLASGRVKWTIYDDKKPHRENPDMAVDSLIGKIPNRENPYRDNPDVLIKTDLKQILTKDITNTEIHAPEKSDEKPVEKTPLRILADFGVYDQLAKDFIKARNKKGAPITITAMKGIEREAAKARISIQDAVTICIERGWQGFNSSWDWNNKATNNFTFESKERRYENGMTFMEKVNDMSDFFGLTEDA